jgi:Raf kinase inhibitor-like YbhB/YbcL family protein
MRVRKEDGSRIMVDDPRAGSSTSLLHRGARTATLPVSNLRQVRRPTSHVIALLLTASLLGSALAACGGSEDGDENAGDDPADTSDDASGRLSLSSPAFNEGDPIPAEYSLAGGDVSPPLTWSGVPDGTAELALTVVDPDAGNFLHWVVAGIDPSLTSIEKGSLPADSVQALNNFGEADWGGPAPPPGPAHTYVFTLYALAEPSGIAEGSPGNDAVTALSGSGAPTAVLRATFQQR